MCLQAPLYVTTADPEGCMPEEITLGGLSVAVRYEHIDVGVFAVPSGHDVVRPSRNLCLRRGRIGEGIRDVLVGV